jgi:predicted RNase H-like HicB family nuclease
LEHRHRRADSKRTRSLDEPSTGNDSTVDTLSLPNIAELIDYGEITIGVVRPVGCVAVANDEDNCLAMLRRRQGETLAQLLTRLDQAIGKALADDIFTDEINPPSQ